MAARQTRQTGLGAPGTTGAEMARDPLGAPGSTGASRTNMGVPGYDPKDYSAGGGEQQQMHRPGAGQEYTYGTGEQQQMHRPGTGQEYTYGTAGSMGPTAAGYHAGVHVPVTTPGVTTATYRTSGGGLFDHSTGVGGGGGYDTGKMGERVHGVSGERAERGERFEATDAGIGSGYDFGEMTGERIQGIGDERAGHLGGYDTGGGRLNEREGQGQQRRS